jgi:choice-of-anchor B domain-containing protein
MSFKSVRIAWAAALATTSVASIATAHQDDPKIFDRTPPYVGPAFRAAFDTMHAVGFPAVGIELMANLPNGEFDDHGNANDCWGYTSPTGREYAILCLTAGTGFVEITTPAAPVVLATFDAFESTWRDAKVYQDHAYVVTEDGGGGIQVFDMSDIDSGNVTQLATVMEGGSGSSHNVALNEDTGFLYRCGGSGNGLRIYDLSDPAAPEFVAEWNTRYVHDAQIVVMQDGPWAGREIAFCCGGYNGGWVETGLDIVDVTDKDDIQWLASYIYPEGVYSHQGWLSDDQQYFYLGDELDEDGVSVPTKTFVMDVSDLENPFTVDAFTNGNSAVGHNLYVKGSLIFEANYTSGLRVFDASVDPVDPPEVAYFDTVPDTDEAGYAGLWSNYPYFASGTIIGSDRQMGLFVWRLEDSGIPWDLDDSGHVDFGDLLQLLASWGECPGCPADFDGDGFVVFTDLLEMLANWG